MNMYGTGNSPSCYIKEGCFEQVYWCSTLKHHASDCCLRPDIRFLRKRFSPTILSGDVDPSPYCMKALSFARFLKAPLEIRYMGKMSSNGQLPWGMLVVTDGQKIVVEDSHRLISALKRHFAPTCDAHLTDDDKLEAAALEALLDNTLYQCIVRHRWVDNFPFVKSNYRLPVPSYLKSFVLRFVRKSLIRQA